MVTFEMICLFPTQPAALYAEANLSQSVAVNALTFLHTRLLMYSFFKFQAVPMGLCLEQDWGAEVVAGQ